MCEVLLLLRLAYVGLSQQLERVARRKLLVLKLLHQDLLDKVLLELGCVVGLIHGDCGLHRAQIN